VGVSPMALINGAASRLLPHRTIKRGEKTSVQTYIYSACRAGSLGASQRLPVEPSA
jgi:hypothetical protein